MGVWRMKTANRDRLVEIEKKVRGEWKCDVRHDFEKKKMFITFPYPYMNGTLHLGHGFTVSKAIFSAEFYRLQGYNVLFPFAFHGSGMPIVASAARLKVELEGGSGGGGVIKSLLEMGVGGDELKKFVDPNYWLVYFPLKARQDITDFGGRVDWRRSFITTEVNFYYDSFVKWQFRKLIDLGLVVFGKRYVVYSEKDRGPCADHDRSLGEGVKPRCMKTGVMECDFEGEKVNMVVSVNEGEESDKIECSDGRFVIFKYRDNKYLVSEWVFKNLSHQLEGVCEVKFFDERPRVAENMKIEAAHFLYYEPGGVVISRSGDKCIVAKSDQWFINYRDEKLKERVNKYIEKGMFCPDLGVFNLMMGGWKWLEEWPCSRNFGLGSKLPGGGDQLIDSLSDSTIYMAFYTIGHLIEKVPKELVDGDFWDYILGITVMPDRLKIVGEIVDEMRNEFRYWYPVDIRVSAKDLISNHLTMSLYNHIAIWGEELSPKSYCINGYIKYNGEKMSKNLGNFITLRDAIDKYGADATRLALCQADGIEDADFMHEMANSSIMKLTYEREWFEGMIEKFRGDIEGELNIWDNLFLHDLLLAMNNAFEHFRCYRFRKGLYEGFHASLLLRDRYVKSGGVNLGVLKRACERILVMVYPICPHFVEYLWGVAGSVKFERGWNYERDVKEAKERGGEYEVWKYQIGVVENLVWRIGRVSKNRGGRVLITLAKGYGDLEKDAICRVIGHCKSGSDKKLWNKFVSDGCPDRKKIGEYGRVMTKFRDNYMMHGMVWYEKFVCEVGGLSCVEKWTRLMLKGRKNLLLEFREVEFGDDRFSPDNPLVEYEKN
ncbi:MAG: leucyl-tRNA synthetase [Hyperionvirus sp.]|uniref:leucine--tRNA ligase n=1 Tax=Hyperionvirus sp. TaxID=2487770 RepID=A0A3G5ADR5_9VIRU|nr:MAG: leucyl-tRNA synthetase [Hyperionvirus sp.]